MRSFRKLLTLSTAVILLGTVAIGAFLYHLGRINISVAIVVGGPPQIPIVEKNTASQRPPPPPATNVTPIASTNTRPPCPTPKLAGAIKVELDKQIASKFPESLAKTINKGGWWTPPNCKPRKEVAILVPFRDRDIQLKMFLYHMHPFLQKQMLAYRIFVIEHLPSDAYNKGATLNAGFLHVRNYSNYDCFIFHDIDYLPEHDGNDYGCVASPRHYALCTDINGYKPWGGQFMGGVFSADRKTFETSNGYSNLYFGWGGEDDDVGRRFRNKGFEITRPDCKVGRYTKNKHEHVRKSGPMEGRLPLAKDAIGRMDIEGLTSIKYKMKNIKEEALYTLMRVEVRRSDYTYPKCETNKIKKQYKCWYPKGTHP